MSKFEKLLVKFLSCPTDFTYMELRTILKYMDYEEIEGAGSRICFKKDRHKIKLHKPHPGNILKRYQLKLVIDELKKEGLL